MGPTCSFYLASSPGWLSGTRNSPRATHLPHSTCALTPCSAFINTWHPTHQVPCLKPPLNLICSLNPHTHSVSSSIIPTQVLLTLIEPYRLLFSHKSLPFSPFPQQIPQFREFGAIGLNLGVDKTYKKVKSFEKCCSLVESAFSRENARLRNTCKVMERGQSDGGKARQGGTMEASGYFITESCCRLASRGIHAQPEALPLAARGWGGLWTVGCRVA